MLSGQGLSNISASAEGFVLATYRISRPSFSVPSTCKRKVAAPAPTIRLRKTPRVLRGRKQQRGGANVGTDGVRLLETQDRRELHDELAHRARPHEVGPRFLDSIKYVRSYPTDLAELSPLLPGIETLQSSASSSKPIAHSAATAAPATRRRSSRRGRTESHQRVAVPLTNAAMSVGATR
jgi:hypothetical protein